MAATNTAVVALKEVNYGGVDYVVGDTFYPDSNDVAYLVAQGIVDPGSVGQYNAIGISGGPVNSTDMTTAANVTDAPTSGKKLVIEQIIAGAAGACYVDLQEEASGHVFLRMYLPASQTIAIQLDTPIKLATADKHLQGKASTAVAVSIAVMFHSEK